MRSSSSHFVVSVKPQAMRPRATAMPAMQRQHSWLTSLPNHSCPTPFTTPKSCCLPPWEGTEPSASSLTATKPCACSQCAAAPPDSAQQTRLRGDSCCTSTPHVVRYNAPQAPVRTGSGLRHCLQTKILNGHKEWAQRARSSPVGRNPDLLIKINGPPRWVPVHNRFSGKSAVYGAATPVCR